MSDLRNTSILKLLRASLNNEPFPALTLDEWENAYSDIERHMLWTVTMNEKALSSVPVSIRNSWNTQNLEIRVKGIQLRAIQKYLLEKFKEAGIPVVVVKGTSAAHYYPNPELRMFGDIDLLVTPNYYNAAVETILKAGGSDITLVAELKAGRHRCYMVNGFVCELHKHFSSHVNPIYTDTLDKLIFAEITPDSTILPDMLNGLILIEHIAQHLNGGLGLRRIIDWWMFVNQCLDDKTWEEEFKPLTDQVGLTKLTMTITKMCQLYLGLKKEILWCKDSDDSTCAELMEYILSCGDFGCQRELKDSGAVTIVPSIKQPIKLLKYTQQHGECNWKALKNFPWLKPFAFIYQGCVYARLICTNRINIKGIYDEGKKRREFFTKLGIEYGDFFDKDL